MKKIKLILFLFSVLLLPILVTAQIGAPVPRINLNLVQLGNNIANAAWIVFTVIAVIAFIIAGVLFLTSAGSAEKITQARNAFLWGVAGVVVGVIAFTIITLVTSFVTTGQ